MERIRQAEITMAADPVHSELDAERAYWQTRLASLETLLCELLLKNERLRQERQISASVQSEQRAVLMDS